MRRTFLLIDGYNLMHAAGYTRAEYGPGQFQDQRNRFLAYLTDHLSRIDRRNGLLVFDAHHAPAEWSRGVATVRGLSVQFSPHGIDADTEIEAILAGHPAPRQVRLVSGDRRLIAAAKRRGARPVTSDGFLDELVAAEQKSPSRRDADAAPIAEPAKSTPGGDWSDYFGDIDLSALRDEVARTHDRALERVGRRGPPPSVGVRKEQPAKATASTARPKPRGRRRTGPTRTHRRPAEVSEVSLQEWAELFGDHLTNAEIAEMQRQAGLTDPRLG